MRRVEGRVFPGSSVVKNPPANSGHPWTGKFNPWTGKIPWRRKWQPTPVFLPGKSHRQRSLGGYSPWGGKKVRYDLITEQSAGKYYGTAQGSHVAVVQLNILIGIVVAWSYTCDKIVYIFTLTYPKMSAYINITGEI